MANQKGMYDADKYKIVKFITSPDFNVKIVRYDTEGTKCDWFTLEGQLKYTRNVKNGAVRVATFTDCSNKRFYFDLDNGMYLEPDPDYPVKIKPISAVLQVLSDYKSDTTSSTSATPSHLFPKHLVEFLSDKQNRRRYKEIDTGITHDDNGRLLPGNKIVLVPDYWLAFILRAKLRQFRGTKKDLLKFVYGDVIEKKLRPYKGREATTKKIHKSYLINHINGDSYDCSADNLELATYKLNNAHARLMSEICWYFKDLIDSLSYNSGDISYNMHRYTDGEGISCAMIEQYNQTHPHNIIKGFIEKNGVFNSRFSREEMIEILEAFEEMKHPRPANPVIIVQIITPATAQPAAPNDASAQANANDTSNASDDEFGIEDLWSSEDDLKKNLEDDSDIDLLTLLEEYERLNGLDSDDTEESQDEADPDEELEDEELEDELEDDETDEDDDKSDADAIDLKRPNKSKKPKKSNKSNKYDDDEDDW